MKILIVDDLKLNRYMLGTLLGKSGYEYISAANGEEALEKLRSEKVDLVISDIQMPVMDGFRLCREVKLDEKLKETPVIFYSATFFEEKDKELAYKVGADMFIKKPDEMNGLLDIIQNMVNITEDKQKLKHDEEGLADEKEILKLYSERVFSKLEKKTLDLQREISEHKRIKDALHESEKRYRAVVEDIPSMICRFLPNGKLTFVNNTFCKYFNKTEAELIRQVFFRFHEATGPGNTLRDLMSLTNENPIITTELKRTDSNGKIQWQEWTDRAIFDENGLLTEYQSVGRDITENKFAMEEKAKLEKQLQQAQKMEAIGTLAGGIAHDFNNILSAIIGYTDLAAMKVEKDAAVKSDLDEVLIASARAEALVKQILAFSRQSEQEKKPVQVKLIAQEALKLLRSSLPSTIEIRENLQSNSLVISDPTQIHQVFMNLCTNAGHAMRENGGFLTVDIVDVEIDAGTASKYPDILPGPFLKLAISDTGHGMTPDVQERIFDPFFTTKEKGEGTGMGLSVVHGIVTGSGGTITVYSEPEKGTTFNVFLPAVISTAKKVTRIESPLPTGTERILLVDDEPTLLDIGKQMLASLGYQVETRNSSIEALALFKARPDRFDLIITDMTMPHLTGDKLAKEMMATRSGIPVILCTGFSPRIDEKRTMEMGIRAFVTKPIIKKVIAETIRTVLDKK